MSKAIRVGWMVLCGSAALLATDFACWPKAPPTIRTARQRIGGWGGPSVGSEWAKLPGGREMDRGFGVDVDGRVFGRSSDVMRQPAAGRKGRSVRSRLHVSRRQAQAPRHDLQVRPGRATSSKLRRSDFIWPHGMHVDAKAMWAPMGPPNAVATAAKAG
jgi:hypothetical protein